MRTTDPIPAHIHQIRAAMAARGATQAQIAAALGITQSGISRRLNGSQPFRVNELEAIAAHLGCQLVINLEAAA